MLSSLALSTSSSSHIAHTLQSMSNLGSDGANFCQLVLIGLTAETSQELMLQSFPNCALIQYGRYDSNSTALTRGTTRSTRLVIVAAQGAFEPPVLGKQVESRIGSLLVLISERNLIKEFAVSFENIRVLNLVAIRGNQGDERQFNLFMSCEGSPEFRKIDVWQERNKQFLLGKDLETINGLCIKVLETKTLKSGKLGIVPYSFNDAGATQVRGAYMDAFRLMSQKFGFSLRFKASKGFGTINTTTGTWNGMMGQVLAIYEKKRQSKN